MLQEKNKSMKIVHSSPTPWRCIAKGLDLFYVKPAKKLSTDLIEINSRVAEVGPYCKVDLHVYLPICPQKDQGRRPQRSLRVACILNWK